MQSLYEKGCDELTDESLAIDMCAMQSTYEKGCDDLTDDSGATDICAHCAPESKLQPALYFCFHCGPFGRYMCGDCNRQHKKFACKHEVKSISTAEQQTRESTKRECNDTKDESGAIDICAHCASDNNIVPACFFCFHCGSYGRYMCGICNKQHRKYAIGHDVRKFSSEAEPLQLRKEMVRCGKKRDRALVVVAIHLRNKNSSFALSFISDFDKDPFKIKTPIWHVAGYGPSTVTPTCVLFDANKKFQLFGFEAQEKYIELSDEREHGKYYFFREFIQYHSYNMLFNQKLMFEDGMGKKMDAMIVLSSCIKYMRDRAIGEITKYMYSDGFFDNDFRWVLTVPASCIDASRQFMREAAQMAGINGEHLQIVIRSQAASLYCRYLYENNLRCSDVEPKQLAPISKYLIIEVRDSTTEICIHVVKDDGTLEWYTAHVGNWGGIHLEKAFRDFLVSIVGNSVMDNFQAINTWDYKHLFREFKIKMSHFHGSLEKKTTLSVPFQLFENFEEATGKKIFDHIKRFPEYDCKVLIRGNRISVENSIVEGWFKETCDGLVCHLKSLFSKSEVHDVPTIFMVGKVCEFPLIKNVILSTFKNKNIRIPEDPSWAVLRGAVMFGHLC